MEQDNRPALGVQRQSHVLQTNAKPILGRRQVAEMMAGPQQGHQVLAGTRSMGDVQGQVVNGLFPGLPRAGLDLIARLFVHRAAVTDQVFHE